MRYLCLGGRSSEDYGSTSHHVYNCNVCPSFLTVSAQRLKNKCSKVQCLSTWLFHLCNKSGGNLSEIQRTRLPKLCSLTTCTCRFAPVYHVHLKAWPIQFGTRPIIQLYSVYTVTSCEHLHKQLYAGELPFPSRLYQECKGRSTTLSGFKWPYLIWKSWLRGAE